MGLLWHYTVQNPLYFYVDLFQANVNTPLYVMMNIARLLLYYF